MRKYLKRRLKSATSELVRTAKITRRDLLAGAFSGVTAITVIAQVKGILTNSWSYEGLLDTVFLSWYDFVQQIWIVILDYTGIVVDPLLFFPITLSALLLFTAELSSWLKRGEPISSLILRVVQRRGGWERLSEDWRLLVLVTLPTVVVCLSVFLGASINAARAFSIPGEAVGLIALSPLISILPMAVGFNRAKFEIFESRGEPLSGGQQWTRNDLLLPVWGSLACVFAFLMSCGLFRVVLGEHNYQQSEFDIEFWVLSISILIPAFGIIRSLVINWRDLLFLASWIISFFLSEMTWAFISLKVGDGLTQV